MRHSLIVLSAVFLFFSCEEKEKPSIDKEIAAIENGLLPAVQLAGKEETYSLADRMEFYKVRGLSIAVVKDGEIHWSKGYGVANAENDKKVDANTLFQAGSISKPLAALAALQLVEEGKLTLDENIKQYLSDWSLPENHFLENEKITLRRLLTHTAGLNVSGFPGYAQTDSFPTVQMVLNGEGNTPAVEVDTLPGSMWKYSGGGYTIMEKMVEDVSGLPLEKYMEKHVLKPIGMERSTYAQPLPKEKYAYASAAFDKNGEMIEGAWHNYPEQAAAGLWTTAPDLAKYCIAIQNGLTGEENDILSQEMIEKMLTKHQFNWGLGPQLRGEGDSLIFQHSGRNAGFTNNLVAFAHQGNAVVVMTNSDKGNGLISEIIRSVSAYYKWNMANPRHIKPVELKTATIDSLTGIYKSPSKIFGNDNYRMEVKTVNDRLTVVDLVDGEKLNLTAISDSTFIDAQKDVEVEFEKGEGPLSLIWGGALRFEKMN